MKRIVTLILAPIILILSSCNMVTSDAPKETETQTTTIQNEEKEIPYKVWDLNYDRPLRTDDRSHLTDVESTFRYNSGSYTDSSVTKDITIDFNDTEYTASYSSSVDYYGVYPTVDYYKEDDGEVQVTFGIDRVSKKVVYYSRKYDKEDYEQKINSDIPMINEEECQRIASEYLSNIVNNFSEFTLYSSSYHDAGLNHYPSSQCFLQYSRFIKGIRTSEKIFFTVDVWGEVLSYDLTKLGNIEDDAFLSDEIVDLVYQNLDDYIRYIYEDYVYKYMYKITDVELERLYGDDRYIIRFVTVEKTSETYEQEQNYPVEDRLFGFGFGYFVYVT